MGEKEKKQVLIVDDEFPIRKLVTAVLRDKYEVSEAGNGIEALEVVRKTEPGLILLDVLMPGMDGYSFLSYLKEMESKKDIPVIMVTAIDHELNRSLGYSMGVSDWLTKPFTDSDLLKIVEKNIR